MTIDILTIPLATLEAMSDAELHAHFASFFNVTRPQPKEKAPASKVYRGGELKRKAGDALEMLAKLNLPGL